MTDRFYTKEDSAEVRQIYFETVRKNRKPDTRKIIVTNEVWTELEKRGANMDKYERYEELRKKHPALPRLRERPMPEI